jgi:outer membrane receptor protein involved in Fe transport
MFYFNAAQGFRPGALQTAANVAALQAVTGVVTNIQLETDSLWSYEVGAKWSLFDNTLSVNGSVYLINWNDAQFQTGLSGISGIVNLGDIKGRGFDLQLVYATPIPGLTFQAAGGYNSTTIDNINPKITAGLPFLQNGVQVPNVPKGNVSFSLNYARPLNYHELVLLADATYQYRAKESDLATGRQSADLNIFSFEVGVQKAAYQVMFFIDNATDERGPSIWEQGRMIVPRPRTIGMRLAFSPEL